MRHAFRLPLHVVVLAACGGDAAEPAATATIDTLPNGAILVHNDAVGAWDSASAWRFEEIARIGSMEGAGPDVFADVRDIEVDAYGRVWVLDARQKKIEVFDSAGGHVRTVGRPGAGPGELEYPIGLELDPLGRVWVLDPRNTRYSVFDTSGAYVTSHRRESSYTPYRWEGGVTADGRVFDTSVVYGDAPDGRDILVERDSTGVARDTFDLPRLEQELYELRVDGTLMQTVPVPFTPRAGWRIAEDGTFWTGTTDDYRIVQRTLEGDTLRIVERDWTPLPVTQQDRDLWLGFEWIEEMRQRGADIDPGRIPPTKPAWSSFRIDDDGYLWVVPTTADGDVVVFDVFDPDGLYLGDVTLDELTSEPLIRGGRMYFVVRDELDVPYVVIGRLAGREPAS